MDLATAERACLLGDTQPLVESLSAMMADEALRAPAQLRRAEVRMVRRELESAIEDVLEAGRALAGDPERAVVAELLAARLLNRTLRVDAANALMQHVEPRVEPGLARSRVMLGMTRGEMALDAKDLPAARAAFEAVLPQLGEPRWAHEAAQAWLCLAAIAQLQGRTADAALALIEVLQLAEQHADGHLAAEPRFTLGVLHLRIQDVSGSRSLLEPAADDPLLSPRHRAMAHALLGRVSLTESRWDEAVRRGLLGARLSAGLDDPYGYLEGSVIVATAQARSVGLDEARKTCEAAGGVLRQRGHADLADVMDRHLQDLRGAGARP